MHAMHDSMQQALRPPVSTLSTVVFKLGYGRLGNRLYRFGNIMAFAKEHGLRAIDFSFVDDGYASYFQNLTELRFCEYPLPGSTEESDGAKLRRQLMGSNVAYVENLDDAYDLDFELESAKGKEILWLDGFHFHADHLVDKHRRAIQSFFQPIDSVRMRVDTAFQSLRAQYQAIVGVHIRQSDFKSWNDGKCFFEVSDYADAMRSLHGQLLDRKPLFLVFSDEGLDDALFKPLPVLFSNGEAIEDMYSLSQCDYILGAPNSTFSGWASFFGDTPILNLKGREDRIDLQYFEVNRYLNNHATA